MKPLTVDSPVLGITSTIPRITRPYSTAPMKPEPTIMTGTSRRGLCISSDAPLDTSNPTHRNTRIPIAVRKPLSDGFRSAAVEAPAGRPCWTRNAMNSTVNRPTTAILTNVPMLGPHLPIRNATIAIPTVTQVNTRPTAISQPVPSDLCRIKLSRAAIVVAVSVPPTQIGLDSQYKTEATAAGARPKDMRAHSYGPPSTGKAEPSSATSIP